MSAKAPQKELIKRAVYVLDTNVLLNMYRIPKSSRENLLNDLAAKSDRVWMPFQVALELHRNCDKVRSAQTSSHSERIKEISAAIENLRANGKSTRLEKSAEQVAALDALQVWKVKLEEELEAIREEIDHQKPDEVLERIADIFGDSIGPEPTADDLEALSKEAGQRYKTNTPPGYLDQGKSEGRGDGDFIAWRQTMEYSKSSGNDIVFVTDDNKDDWKMRLNSKVLRARPELIVEFQKQTGQDITIISSRTFFYEISSERTSPEAEIARNDLNAVVRDEDERNAVLWEPLTKLFSEIQQRGETGTQFDSRWSEALETDLTELNEQSLGGLASAKRLVVSLLEKKLSNNVKAIDESYERLKKAWLLLDDAKRSGNPILIEHTQNLVDEIGRQRTQLVDEYTDISAKLDKARMSNFTD